MSRNRQLVRVFRLLSILRERRCTAMALSRELSVTSRTIRRDLEAIEEANLPLYRHLNEDGIAVWSYRGDL